jgi:acyl-coenzyme A thioesterase PaaI-like protein
MRQPSPPTVNEGRDDAPLLTASLRVNFLRQFRACPDEHESRYEGTALRIGRSSDVPEARAVDANGNPAIIARVTAYR